MFARPAIKAFSQIAGDDTIYPGEKLHRTPTYCEICFWKCAGWVYTDKKGKIKKIVGNKEDPHCNGRLCPRGTGGVGMFYDNDRLKTPLIREGKPGSQHFQEATWEEALDLIAKNLDKVRKEHGPECVVLFSHGTGGKIISHLLKAFGSPNIAAPSFAQCRGPREVAFTALHSVKMLCRPSVQISGIPVVWC